MLVFLFGNRSIQSKRTDQTVTCNATIRSLFGSHSHQTVKMKPFSTTSRTVLLVSYYPQHSLAALTAGFLPGVGICISLTDGWPQQDFERVWINLQAFQFSLSSSIPVSLQRCSLFSPLFPFTQTTAPCVYMQSIKADMSGAQPYMERELERAKQTGRHKQGPWPLAAAQGCCCSRHLPSSNIS